MLGKLMCKLNVGHKWHVERTDDGTRYRRCTRCGKDEDDSGGSRLIIDAGA